LVNEETSILDIGCGPGRLLIGLRAELPDVGPYTGLDVDAVKIAWASRRLASTDPAAQFFHLNLLNERYNPIGERIARARLFPVPDKTVDLAVLISVFSHLRLQDVIAYLAEIRRVIGATGGVYLTAFVEDGVPAEEENPSSYLREWSGPLHCVRFARDLFDETLRDAGFVIRDFRHRDTPDRQSSYVLGPAAL